MQSNTFICYNKEEYSIRILAFSIQPWACCGTLLLTLSLSLCLCLSLHLSLSLTTHTHTHTQQQQSCSYTSSGIGAEMSGSIEISSGSESDLQSAVANVGPVSVAVDGSNNAFRVSCVCVCVCVCTWKFIDKALSHSLTFTHTLSLSLSLSLCQYYSSGVYSSSRCYSYSSKLNHALLVTGYGTYNGKEFWLVKNRCVCVCTVKMECGNTISYINKAVLRGLLVSTLINIAFIYSHDLY